MARLTDIQIPDPGLTGPPLDMTGLILVGGDSRRMGRPKADIELGGQTLLEHVLSKLSPVCRQVILVARRPSDFLELDLRIVRDLVPGQGPLSGLATGLFYSRYTWALTLACDLPFLSESLLRYLAQKALAASGKTMAVVPRTEAGWEPLVAVYSKDCLPTARKLLDKGRRKIYELSDYGLPWQAVGPDELQAAGEDPASFFNINTPEDLKRAESWPDFGP